MTRAALWIMICLFTLASSLKNPEMGIRTTLLHRDHYPSPFHNSSKFLTREDRVADLVQRSIVRIHHLERKRHMITVESPMSYASEGAYIMNISLGTPRKSFLVVVDTGSDLTWVQCKPCFDCFRSVNSIFDPTKSSSYRHISCSDSLCKKLYGRRSSCSRNGTACQYTVHYGDGSQTHGDLVTETLTVETTDRGNMASNSFAFGCGHNNTGEFNGIDGLVGLGKGLFSFPSQIRHFVSGKFSYCLVSFWKASVERSELLFGSLAAADSFNMSFTPLVHNEKRSSNYYIQMEDIAVDGVPLGISPSAFQINSDNGLGGTFVDSGTTITHLVRPAYEALLRNLNASIDYPLGDGSSLKLDLCFNTTGIVSPRFPAVSLQFRGALLDLPSQNAFISVDSTDRTVCLAMVESKYFNVIGSIQMQNFRFLYDLENSRIGFKSENCGALNLPV